MAPGAGESLAPKRYTHGTHRTCAPEETLARLQPLLATWGSRASPTSPGSTARGPGGDGGAAERAVGRSVAGQGPDAGRCQGVGGDGGGGALARGADREPPEAHEPCGDAPRAPGRRPGSAAARRGRRLSSAPADPVDRGARPRGRGSGLGAVRAGGRQLHAAAPAGQRLLPGEHQRARLREPSAGGDLPRPLRGGGAGRLDALEAAPRRRSGARSTRRASPTPTAWG